MSSRRSGFSDGFNDGHNGFGGASPYMPRESQEYQRGRRASHAEDYRGAPRLCSLQTVPSRQRSSPWSATQPIQQV